MNFHLYYYFYYFSTTKILFLGSPRCTPPSIRVVHTFSPMLICYRSHACRPNPHTNPYANPFLCNGMPLINNIFWHTHKNEVENKKRRISVATPGILSAFQRPCFTCGAVHRKNFALNLTSHNPNNSQRT